MNRNRSFLSLVTGLSLSVLVASVLVAGSSLAGAMINNATLAAFNKAPDAVDDSGLTNNNPAITIDVLRNDTDADGDSLTVSAVTQPANGQVINNGTNVTYTPNLNFFGPDSFTYTASDGLLTDTAVVRVDVNRVIHLTRVPSADAGPDQTALVAATVQLNGDKSSDPDGDPLTFQWAFQSLPTGSTAVLFNSTAVDPTFVLDQPGIYVVQLIVNDGHFDSAPDTVQISTVNSAPVANAGADQTTSVVSTVTLDGSGSTDVDGNPLTFQWSFQSRPVGSAAVLSDPTAVNPTFIVDQQGNYVVELTVNDGLVNSAPDTVIISTQNSIPVANAGSDQSTSVGLTVQLDGSGSNDADGDPLTFQWSIVSLPPGSTATLSSPTAVNPSFLVDQPGTYVLQLIVNDGHVDSVPDTVTISTAGSIPIANAGADQTVTAGETVQLDGSASADPDGTALQFSWALITRPSASVATLSDSTIVNPTFVADLPGVYIAQLIVSDGVLVSAADTVMIMAVAPLATLIATDVDAAEAGPEPGSFMVSRTGDTSFALTVNYSVDGTATNGIDYTSIPASLTIPAGSPTAVITITPIDDNVLEDSEAVVLTLMDGAAYDVGTESTATVTIADNDPPAVTIDATDPDAAEAGGDSGTFTISRTGPTTSSLTVTYTITGSATNGIDYTTLPASVIIPGGASSATITVAPLDDTAFELPESVILTLAPGANYLIGSPHSAAVTIADNDTLVSVLATDSAAAEEGDPATFTVSRSGPSTNALDVFYTIGGTAINGTDYATLSGSVTILAGSTTALVTVTPIDDALFEGPETVVLSLSPDSAYTVSALGAATVTITDDERPTVTLRLTDDASEVGLDPGTFTVTRTGPTTNPLIVNYTIGGGATNGVDYQTISTSVTIPGGSATGTVVITPLADDLIEGAENVVLGISGGVDYAVGTPSLASLTIADDDLAVVTVTANGPATELGPTTGTFTLTRTGDTAEALTVICQRGGTASSNSDYASIGGTNFAVTIPAGQSSVAVTITPLADNLVEGDETVVVAINPSLSYVLGTPSSATLTIVDDPPVVNMSATDALAGEAGPDIGVFSFTRTGGNLAAALSVIFSRGGTASIQDFAGIGATATIPANQTLGTVTITPIADNVVEGDETVVLTVIPSGSLSSNYVIGTLSSGTVTIADDPVIVTVTSVTDPSASEAGPDPGVFAFTRSGGALTTSLLILVHPSGTATNGFDYASIGGSNFFVTIPANQTTATVIINPLPDNRVEPAETAILTIQPLAAYSIGTPSSATVTIADDPVVVSVTATDANAAEAGQDQGVFTFTRSGGNLAAALTVTFSRSGTATNSSDYLNIGFSVVIPANLSSMTVTITPIDDPGVEGSETVILTITASTNYLIGTPASATVTIADND